MIYLALGDSISIDDYTSVEGGGAASQFARLLRAEIFHNFTRDGCMTDGVIAALREVPFQPDVVTLTAGGNDLLSAAFGTGNPMSPPTRQQQAQAVGGPLKNLQKIAERLADFHCPVVINTIYDPTDGRDTWASELEFAPQWRGVYNRLNDGIRQLATTHGFLLSDLETLFHGHGVRAADTWFTMQIEPNYDGATAIAHHWNRLYRQTG